MMNSVLVHSTVTLPAPTQAEIDLERIRWADSYAGEDFCHVCGRVTDHRGEHSDEQLLAFYHGKGRMFRR